MNKTITDKTIENNFKLELNKLLEKYNVEMQVSLEFVGYNSYVSVVNFYSYKGEWRADSYVDTSIDFCIGEGTYGSGFEKI